MLSRSGWVLALATAGGAVLLEKLLCHGAIELGGLWLPAEVEASWMSQLLLVLCAGWSLRGY